MRLHGLIILVAFCVGCGGKTELYVPNAALTSDSGVTKAGPSYPSGAVATYGFGGDGIVMVPMQFSSTLLMRMATPRQRGPLPALTLDCGTRLAWPSVRKTNSTLVTRRGLRFLSSRTEPTVTRLPFVESGVWETANTAMGAKWAMGNGVQPRRRNRRPRVGGARPR
jgi:hypothetical protein